MLSPNLDALGLRPLRAADAAELYHRSRAIPERLGFREEGTLRDAELINRQYLDSVVYGVLEDEWS